MLGFKVINVKKMTPPEAHLTLNTRNIPIVNHVKYLGLILDKRIAWRLHREMIEGKTIEHFLASTSYSKVKA
jgi:hypothetical protein